MKITRIVLAVAAATMLASAASVAVAADGPAPNAFGLKYIGSSKCLSCHGSMTGRWQVGAYPQTSHGLNVRSVTDLGGVGGITPSASSTSYWPSPIFGTGTFRFAPADVWLQMGSPNSENRRFVSKFKNDGPHTLSTGDTLPNASGPADDLIMFNARFYTDDPHWNPSAVTSRLVFQNCGPCHFTGVTRPSEATFTLPNGGSITSSTESTMAAYGIQCESCHASSEEGSHWNSGVSVTRSLRALDSQTCAQCHASFSSNEKNYTGGRFSNPSGFTPDQDLTDFGTHRGSEYVQQNMFVPAPSIPETDSNFYPSGHRRFGGHGAPIFNEYQLSGHARTMRNPDGSLAIPFLKDECLPCHSGEAFLQSLGYGTKGPNEVALHESSISNDVLNIECAVCHTVHDQGGTPLGLRLEGDELCVQCHIEGTAEIRHGEGLVGVSTPREWMPDAECSSCHMPELDGMKSHRFTTLLPGDAEEWEVPEDWDSCSPCHRGSTRAKLQASIDEWQGPIAAGLTSAKSGLAAAKKRTAATSPQGKKLIESAGRNIKLVEGDGSLGVHNFPYAKAGLDKATYFARSVGARYSGFATTRFDTRTRTAWVFGTLVYGDGSRAGSQRVTIQARPKGSTKWSTVKTLTTQSDGDFSMRVRPTKTTDYRAVWTPVSGATITSTAKRVAR